MTTGIEAFRPERTLEIIDIDHLARRITLIETGSAAVEIMTIAQGVGYHRSAMIPGRSIGIVTKPVGAWGHHREIVHMQHPSPVVSLISHGITIDRLDDPGLLLASHRDNASTMTQQHVERSRHGDIAYDLAMGRMTSSFEISDRARVEKDRIVLDGEWPLSLASGLPGKRLMDIVDHRAFQDERLVITRATAGDGGITIQCKDVWIDACEAVRSLQADRPWSAA